MEYLSRLLSELHLNSSFKHHPKCSKMNLIHLSYADDLFLFAKGDLQSVQLLQHVLNQFSASSGLKGNVDKSWAFFGVVTPYTLGLFVEIYLLNSLVFHCLLRNLHYYNSTMATTYC